MPLNKWESSEVQWKNKELKIKGKAQKNGRCVPAYWGNFWWNGLREEQGGSPRDRALNLSKLPDAGTQGPGIPS